MGCLTSQTPCIVAQGSGVQSEREEQESGCRPWRCVLWDGGVLWDGMGSTRAVNGADKGAAPWGMDTFEDGHSQEAWGGWQ
eukprot:2760377-Rhodomonas_salina.2